MDEIPPFDFSTFLSPFTWRYGSPTMRELWSEETKRKTWRRVWVALAEAQAELGIISSAEATDLHNHMEHIDLKRAMAIETEIHHDLMAELKTFAEQCQVGGRIIHLGATSADIQDNADAIRLRAALDLLLQLLRDLLTALCEQIEGWADYACMAFTHIQPAEPTTVGYRLAQYGQDLLFDWDELQRVRTRIRGKGIKGAVGTSASYVELCGGDTERVRDLEQRVMSKLGLEAFPVTTQTYPRKQDWFVLNALAGVAGSLHKLMLDLRILQTPSIGEWAEPFGEKQVGSSAMPFKRNPITAEKVDSLARWVAMLPRLAWDNAALSILERTLDDSANRRLLLPGAFLAVDEIVRSAIHVVRGLRVNQKVIARNLSVWGTFAAIERVLMALGRAGADRQQMHEHLRQHSMAAWTSVAAGQENPLCKLLSSDATITQYIPAERIEMLMQAENYVGDAGERAYELAGLIRQQLDASAAES